METSKKRSKALGEEKPTKSPKLTHRLTPIPHERQVPKPEPVSKPIPKPEPVSKPKPVIEPEIVEVPVIEPEIVEVIQKAKSLKLKCKTRIPLSLQHKSFFPTLPTIKERTRRIPKKDFSLFETRTLQTLINLIQH